MKKSILLAFMIVSSLVLFAQPNLMNYQGVARNAVGNVLPNQNITLRIAILNNTANGPTVYSETRNVVTNAFGLFNIVVGSPGAANIIGTIAGVPWANGNKFLQIEIDPNGGSNFTNIGTTQLVSVPYAISAGAALPIGPAGGDLAGNYPNPTVDLLKITTGKIADGAVTTPKLADGVVVTNKITDASVTSEKISFPLSKTLPVPAGALLTMTNSSLDPNATAIRGNTAALNGGSGVSGISSNGGTGVLGVTIGSGYAVYGISGAGEGVYGEGNIGVHGKSTISNAVFGESDNHISIYGKSVTNTGVFGESLSGTGVNGRSTNDIGVIGESISGNGVYGVSEGLSGVLGISMNGFGVAATSINNEAIRGSSLTSSGIHGEGKTNGVFGESADGVGVRGHNTNGSSGVFGESTNGIGVSGSSTNGSSGEFINLNELNSSNNLVSKTKGTGWSLLVSNSNDDNPQGALLSTTFDKGGIALQILNGGIQFSTETNYVSGTPVDDADLVVKNPGKITIPIGKNGQRIWVLNNTNGIVTVTNTTVGDFNISSRRAKEFIYNINVSNVFWIPTE